MKKIATILIILFSSVICFSQTTVNLDHLITETQQMSSSSDKIEMVWWIPDEFWEESFKSDPTMKKEDIDEWINIVSDYSVFLVLSGDIGSFGQISYKSEKLIHKNISLKDRYGKRYYPLSKNEIDYETEYLLGVMHQVLSSMIGSMGENMSWSIFNRNNHKEERLIDPYSSGGFTVSLFTEDYKFKCPLGSLMPTKFCPIDNEELNGAWKYCPLHGKKLK